MAYSLLPHSTMDDFFPSGSYQRHCFIYWVLGITGDSTPDLPASKVSVSKGFVCSRLILASGLICFCHIDVTRSQPDEVYAMKDIVLFFAYWELLEISRHLLPLLTGIDDLCIIEWFATVMDGNKGQGGIQLLLAAEQEAQHIISSARAAKMARLKQAKEEAEREIASYRAQRESEFRKKVAETSGDSGSNVKRLEEETHVKIQHLKSEASKVSPEVVAMLMKYVTTVRN
eukprot:Gb_22481 [translate_table: standard]